MKRLLFALTCLMLASHIHAQEMLPGLYELTVEMKMQGMTIPAPKTTTCFTAQDLAANKQFSAHEKGECMMYNLKKSGGHSSYDVICKGGMTATVTGTVTPTSFNLEEKMRLSPDQGIGDTLAFVKARRIGDCKK